MRAGLLAAALIACSSCTVIEQPAGLIPRWTAAWKDVVTKSDRDRLADWRASFTAALDAARKGGHGADIDREGALLDPDAAAGTSAIPNGLYKCRIIKLGAKTDENLAYVSYPAFYCRVRVERDLQRFNKFGGSQRYVGLIFPGDPLRNVYLGTLAFADEERVLQYGQDDQRDVAGYVERIGPHRWRLIMPYPHFESHVDVMELTPAQ